MNKSLLIGLIAGAGAATALGAAANYARDRSLADPVTQAVPAADLRGTVVRGADDALDPVVGPSELATAPPPDTADVVRTDAGDSRGAALDAAAGEPLPETRPSRARTAPEPESPLPPTPVRARFAEVVDVQSVTETVQESREVCTDVPVTQQVPVKDERRVVGTLAGAVIGGLLGNQVGGGDGRKIATIAGAAAGGYAGNRVQERMQKSNTVSTTERQCQTITEPRERTIAYDVTYSYEGELRTVRMDHEPGRRLPAREGRVLLTADAG